MSRIEFAPDDPATAAASASVRLWFRGRLLAAIAESLPAPTKPSATAGDSRTIGHVSPPVAHTEDYWSRTRRQDITVQQVAALRDAGHTTAQIVAELHCAPATVYHRDRERRRKGAK
jgi:hypothetical protein